MAGDIAEADMPVNILLVDDKEENLVALKAILSAPDYRLVEATSGAKALRRLLDDEFAVLLVDVIMPEMSGFELAAAIKQRERTAAVPILFLTGLAADLNQVYKGYQVGAVDYLVKPLVPEMVRTKVAVFAELYRQRKRIERHVVELDALNKELEAFSYSVSHDLRTPLRAIDGFSRILLAEHAEALDETGRDRLARIRRAAQRMGTLIDDLLNLSRVTRIEPSPEEVDISALVSELAEALHGQDRQRIVRFDVTPGLRARADPGLLRIALKNLLDNAWKFTAHRDEARIEFGAAAGKGGQPIYFVRDNGAGFDMAYAGKLFGTFQRLHGADEFPGDGIGLATVQRVLRKQGGRIWAEAVVDRGATFYFTLA